MFFWSRLAFPTKYFLHSVKFFLCNHRFVASFTKLPIVFIPIFKPSVIKGVVKQAINTTARQGFANKLFCGASFEFPFFINGFQNLRWCIVAGKHYLPHPLYCIKPLWVIENIVLPL